ncbi:tetraacyldisaccharide 4'-kinase [Tenacibaculum aquimarinum]|uniref:tetraacyldisaccharide 4'-kinase n=1 Tax=Tenacibaculum aquimarinum TaxID=2910675 RepID=UPI001F0AD06E|nr:tetraacyldisaccharide 4'-kinase [Tenacibaculum aquimarinum]MCH3883171.1 tetraacyldisaccharide 4'-kinase [Tenacibaculum aquimarinum]
MKLLRFLLFPIAVIYDLITSIRNFLFDKGFFKATSFNVPVIAVGNLSVGGTGKTPQIEYLIRLLKNENKIAVLSRGYKRKSKGFLKLNETHTAEDVGDEPLQYFKKFNNIRVAVDADRTNGITQLLKGENSPEIVLLDDAYQHRKVKASLYILLTKYNDLFTDDFLLPTGNLRESRRGASRASIIIVTKCPTDLSVQEQQKIRGKINLEAHQQLFFSSISYDENISGSENISVNDLNKHEVVLVTGIANPKPLTTYLNTKGINYTHLNFPDHHAFSGKDIVNIQNTFKAISSDKKIILTTEKDYVRLEDKLKDVSYLGIKTNFLLEDNLFDEAIKSHIKC